METNIKISINDRNYEEWSMHHDTTLVQISPPEKFHPVTHHLFNGDVINYNESNQKTSIIHSIVRNVAHIPGILVLVGSKTYGRHPTNPKKLFYKCVPDDRRLPVFIVPYEEKHMKFSKHPHNLYVTFKFNNWENKHPSGTLVQNMGAVNIIAHYYEYILYCKSLNASIKSFTKDLQDVVKYRDINTDVINSIMKNNKIDSRLTERIITIDPKGATDFDDAFGLKVFKGYFILSIYISNVTLWMEELELWESFSERVATVYLPDRKRPMLPTLLSDSICSLKKHQQRFVLAMDIKITQEEGIVDVRYTNALISVSENYTYDSEKLLQDNLYNQVAGVCKILYTAHKDTHKGMPEVKSPHDVIAYLMMLMNHDCAKNMSGQSENGIYRAAVFRNKVSIPKTLPQEIYSYLHNWNNYTGQYIHRISTEHEIMELGCYIHITSPIRRLVDLLNMIAFQKNNNLIVPSSKAMEFYSKWTTVEKMEIINTSMRAIRKVQCDCDLLKLCSTDPNIMEQTFTGVVFDRVERDDGLYQYMVYLPNLKLSSRMTHRKHMENYDSGMFRVFVFMEEEHVRRKVRVSMIDE